MIFVDKKDKLINSVFFLMVLVCMGAGSLLALIVQCWIEFRLLTNLTIIFVVIIGITAFVLIYFIEKENRKEAETKI